MQPIVSVLTTIYNREVFLAEAIDSVLAQTFEDFELILLDDCSTDRSPEIARSYLSDTRVRFYQNEKNLGDYPNRNAAAAHARGTYLKFVDSDDTISKDCLEVMVASMHAHPDAALGLCKSPETFPTLPCQLLPLESYRMHFFEQGIFSNAPLSTIIRRSSFEAVGGFSGKQFVGDSELWLRLAARYPILFLRNKLTQWRSHGAQEYFLGMETGAYRTANYSVARNALLDPACPLTKVDREAALQRLTRQHARSLVREALKGKLRDSMRTAHATNMSLLTVLRAACSKEMKR